MKIEGIPPIKLKRLPRLRVLRLRSMEDIATARGIVEAELEAWILQTHGVRGMAKVQADPGYDAAFQFAANKRLGEAVACILLQRKEVAPFTETSVRIARERTGRLPDPEVRREVLRLLEFVETDDEETGHGD